jgi:3-oxoacyl-[acyl-carrier protein] reductase
LTSEASNNRVALVTGGTRGIGLGIARALAAEGWRLALCGVREPDAIHSVLDQFEGMAEYFQADVGSSADRGRLAAAVGERYGAVNALVNNAGRAPRVRADILDASEDSFEELLRINLQGPYFLTQALARQMTACKSDDPAFTGAIVFVTSVSAEMVSIARGEYCVSKAGLAMAARLFAVRLAPHGIPVYEVRPGIIATDMTAVVRDVYDARIADGLVPERRWGQPDDIGRTVAALVRGDLPYATGSVIHVDGGLAIPRL